MNRIDARFAELRSQRRKALIPFITAGDPSREATVPIMHALVDAGADLIELGVPFSDPMADGPVIQRSSERALARKVGLDYVLDCVRTFRATDSETPVVLMGYLNPVEMRGAERFARAAAQAGVDGVLLVDLPPEEAADMRALLNEHGIQLIALAAPTTSPDRLARMAQQAQGYVYYVSFAGVTGAAHIDTAAVGERVVALRRAFADRPAVPVVVGFGVRDEATAAALARTADGVVVGSALVEALAVAASPADAAQRARAFLAPLRGALQAVK